MRPPRPPVRDWVVVFEDLWGNLWVPGGLRGELGKSDGDIEAIPKMTDFHRRTVAGHEARPDPDFRLLRDVLRLDPASPEYKYSQSRRAGNRHCQAA